MILKSPKWLKWLINFEIVLGKDLDPLVKAKKLQPYLKHLEREKHNKTEIPKEQTKSTKSNAQLVKDIEDIVIRMTIEFQKFPFKDKYSSYNTVFENKAAVKVEYTFENGDMALFTLVNNSEEYLFEYGFKPKVNSLKDFFTTRSTGKRLFSLVKEILVIVTNQSIDRNQKKTTTKEKPPAGKKIDEIVKIRYNTIVKQIKIRQEELNRTNKKAPTYVTLENELNNYKKMADKLKAKLYV
jgi:hypothetical protein